MSVELLLVENSNDNSRSLVFVPSRASLRFGFSNVLSRRIFDIFFTDDNYRSVVDFKNIGNRHGFCYVQGNGTAELFAEFGSSSNTMKKCYDEICSKFEGMEREVSYG
jgi:hypothetical protein